MSRILVMVFAALALATTARAENRQVSVINYFFEDDTTKDQTRIVVREGDQLTFTIRETAPMAHSVNVDELDIHSGEMPLLFQTYTTPPLQRAGTYELYCKTHRDGRNHRTMLVVQAAPQQPTQAPTAAPTARADRHTVTPRAATPTAAPQTPAPTLVPVGLATAPPEDRRLAAPDPRSLEGIIGRPRAAPVPWTRAVRLLALAAVPVVGAAAFAVRKEATRLPPPPPAPQPPTRRPSAGKRKPS